LKIDSALSGGEDNAQELIHVNMGISPRWNIQLMGISGFGALSAMRKAATLLGLLTASTVVAQPVCTAHEHQGSATGFAVTVLAPEGGHADSCCLPAEADALSSPYAAAATPVAHVEPAADGPRLFVSLRVASRAYTFSTRGLAPPRSLAYHVRSARILR
jgi:hypothetical protein